MKKTYAILNLVVTIAMVAINNYAGIKGINGNTVGGLSDKYDSLFTPAGYAFSIWGIIFLALLFHAYYQIKKAFFNQEHNAFLELMGPWLIIANLGNIVWLYAWLNELTGLSVVIMLVILFSLIQLILRLNMQLWDAPFKVIRWIWWPIAIYSGWISVATIANISAYLAKIGWQVGISEEVWAIIMILIATLLNLFMLFNRSMRVFAAVGFWAISAIAVRHWDEIAELQWTAAVCAAILFLAINIHAYKNWETNPINKALKKRA